MSYGPCFSVHSLSPELGKPLCTDEVVVQFSFRPADAAELIAEFDDLGVLNGLRGKRSWDRDALAAILVSAGTLAASGRDWIDTFDINPLVYGPDGFAAVDGLCLLRG
jgi:hypothetical protein